MAGEDVNPDTNASAAAPYVFVFFLFEIPPQFLVPVSALDIFCSHSLLQMPFPYSLSDCMTYLVSVVIVMFYLLFLLIKSFGKLLIYPTILL